MTGRHPVRGKSSPRLDINVSQDIIDRSAVKDSSHCMIAEAVRDAVPKASYISVDLATIRFTDLAAGVRYIYLTPRTAQTALLAFDQGEKPTAFSFKLMDAHVLASGNARKARASLEHNPKSGTKELPVRKDGMSPPVGPLAGGAPGRRGQGANEGAGSGNRTGRRREFGLRAIIR